MRRVDRFRAVFKTLGQPARGSSFRAVPLKFQSSPISAIGSRIADGRYNARATFEALYTAESADTALRELNVVVQVPGGSWITVPAAPHILFTIDYDLSHVVDLTDRDVLTQLKIEPADLLSNWKLDVLGGRVPLTHEIGTAACLAGVEALRVPSARHNASTNIVVIYDQMLTTSRVAIHDPQGFAAGTPTELVGEKTSRFKPGR